MEILEEEQRFDDIRNLKNFRKPKVTEEEKKEYMRFNEENDPRKDTGKSKEEKR